MLASLDQGAAGPALQAHLPNYLTRYFADAGQTERLLGQVLQHRLVTLLGPGGSGKTRLAVQLAEQLAQPGQANTLPPGLMGPMEPARFSVLS